MTRSAVLKNSQRSEGINEEGSSSARRMQHGRRVRHGRGRSWSVLHQPSVSVRAGRGAAAEPHKHSCQPCEKLESGLPHRAFASSPLPTSPETAEHEQKKKNVNDAHTTADAHAHG